MRSVGYVGFTYMRTFASHVTYGLKKHRQASVFAKTETVHLERSEPNVNQQERRQRNATQFTEKYGAEETHSECSVSDTQLF